MNCFICRTEMDTNRENVKYDEVGFPGVTLVDVEVSRCPQCGEYEVAIPRLESLHRALATAVIGKPGRLSGMEIRFLRTFLGYTSADFAKAIGVSPSTVSRWENSKTTIGQQADRLLRLMVLVGDKVPDYPLDRLAELAQVAESSGRYEIQVTGEEWRQRDVAA